ncbi:tetratricopeptide repeat protein [Leadbettera azotonutricia]|uniref:Tetratricopeptide repeat domain protein n=1 Tax=Leadbettera azotonutricia (strain ATCC BAA-888 / DSM 13862 / ZAS-9) TaxID=545695 RepID=F5YAP3_LEAAZ|nr:tetratricopeptide repeat protein [Leadbettera azotonutricia]AEF81383.1 tetratricopeptide repeat domain protein [Leadbettera azotonutricia ZAS-9]
MKKLFGLLFIILGLEPSISLLCAETLPGWFIELREAVYEQELNSAGIAPLYATAKEQAQKELSGPGLWLMLSRCEYMMGRSFEYEDKKDEAAACYEQGMVQAQAALNAQASSEGWRMLAENLAYLCRVRPFSYAMAHGLKVERHADKALELNKQNAAALYLIAARYVFAPSTFNNYKKGFRLLEEIISGYDQGLEKDDRFNVYSAMGYVCIGLEKKEEALVWLQKALELYPTNKYALGMVDQLH